MNRTSRTNRAVRAAMATVAVTGLALGLGACTQIADAVTGTDKAYEVTYEVTGKSVDTIEYDVAEGDATESTTETVNKPALPWTKTVTLRGTMPPSVTPIALDAGSEVACKITYKGKVISEQSAKSLVTLGGCVAVAPIFE
ncbi:MmpS family transport accessory protein [Streptomyces sp. NPDC051569]|uniref:MmpS family transport accessory protein n=1 Tax=Streptomyces sp. NPDC051569 TaxID=3365661 RepID=UPI00378D44C1